MPFPILLFLFLGFFSPNIKASVDKIKNTRVQQAERIYNYLSRPQGFVLFRESESFRKAFAPLLGSDATHNCASQLFHEITQKQILLILEHPEVLLGNSDNPTLSFQITDSLARELILRIEYLEKHYPPQSGQKHLYRNSKNLHSVPAKERRNKQIRQTVDRLFADFIPTAYVFIHSIETERFHPSGVWLSLDENEESFVPIPQLKMRIAPNTPRPSPSKLRAKSSGRSKKKKEAFKNSSSDFLAFQKLDDFIVGMETSLKELEELEEDKKSLDIDGDEILLERFRDDFVYGLIQMQEAIISFPKVNIASEARFTKFLSLNLSCLNIIIRLVNSNADKFKNARIEILRFLKYQWPTNFKKIYEFAQGEDFPAIVSNLKISRELKESMNAELELFWDE